MTSMLKIPKMWMVIPLLPLHHCLTMSQEKMASAMGETIDLNQINSKMSMMNKPLFDRMAELTREQARGGKILDIGSGPGEPAVTLAKLSWSSKIVCTDIQPEMNEKAKIHAKEAGVDSRIEFATASAEDLSAWNRSTFDAVMMSYVLMFVKDKQRALEEMARVLRPGGHANIAVWKELPFYDLAHNATEQVAGKKMPPFEINPLELRDEQSVEQLAVEAGFELLSEETMDYDFNMGTAKDAADGALILAGSTLKQLEDEGMEGATEKFYEAIEKILNDKGWIKDGQVAIPGNSPQMLVLRNPWSMSYGREL